MFESHGSLRCPISNLFFLFSIFKNYSFLIKNLILVTFYPFNIFKMQFCFLWNANYQDELLVKLWFLSLFLYGFWVVMYWICETVAWNGVWEIWRKSGYGKSILQSSHSFSEKAFQGKRCDCQHGALQRFHVAGNWSNITWSCW